MTIKLGFTPKRQAAEKREVLHQFPYLLMETRPIEKGSSYKFRLEGEGVRDLFKFLPRDNKLSYGQLDDNLTTFFLINSSTLEHDKEIAVNLDLSFNSKKLFDRLVEQLNLNSSIQNTFKLELETENGYEGLPTVKLTLIDSNEIENNKGNPDDMFAEANVSALV